jgi:acetylornithine deacetylase/succinyl-diaminopimelate desuccinylase-like protein
MTDRLELDRRSLLGGAAAAAALVAAPSRAVAAAASASTRARIRAAIAHDHDAAVERLADWIRHPGIAAENWRMDESCGFAMEAIREAGFGHVEKVPTTGHPGIFATLDAGAKRTMGIYFMYDVKQADAAEWTSPPFEPTIVDKPGFGRVMVGRGTVNQKGPQACFLNAVRAIRAAGVKLPVNLVLVAEGEEEIGSPHFPEIVRKPHILAALKKAEGVIIPAGWQSPSGGITVNLGAKGIIELELIASGEKWGRGPKGDIHSSEKARVDSPAWRLVEALNTLVKDGGNTPAIDGIMERVRPLSARERQLIAQAAVRTKEEDVKRALGVSRWVGDASWEDALVRLAQQPTVNIEGLVSGYTGPGGKTVLPGKAVAKIDMRLVPDMTAADTLAKLKAHLAARGFGDIEVKMSGGYDPTETAEDSRVIRAQLETYRHAGVATSLYPRLAGSWPGFVFTSAPVGLPAGQFGLGHGSGAHAPNEYYLIDSTNPNLEGMDGSAMSFADFLFQIATVA